MKSQVIKFVGGGGMIVCGVRKAAAKCAYCNGYGYKLCDFVLSSGKTCDTPMCLDHTTKGELKGSDYCRVHSPHQMTESDSPAEVAGNASTNCTPTPVCAPETKGGVQ